MNLLCLLGVHKWEGMEHFRLTAKDGVSDWVRWYCPRCKREEFEEI